MIITNFEVEVNIYMKDIEVLLHTFDFYYNASICKILVTVRTYVDVETKFIILIKTKDKC